MNEVSGFHTIILGLNTLDESTWTTHVEPSLMDFLMATFGERFPAVGKIYYDQVDDAHDITPVDGDDASVHRLLDHSSHAGTFYILTPPTSPAQIAVTFGLLMVSVALGFLFPKDKKDPGRPPRQGSANNTLGDRQNTSRMLARIPDNYGRVRCTPDLVQLPWLFYDNNQQVEVCVMCLGQGTYDVLAADIYEGDTHVQATESISVEIYAPGQLPGLSIPQLRVGNTIPFSAYNVYKVDSVVGQTLFARNAFTIHGSIPFPEMDTDDVNASFGIFHRFMGFSYDSGSGTGHIYIPVHGNDDGTEITSLITVGTTLECRYAPSRTTGLTAARSPQDPTNFTGTVGPPPNLSDNNLGYNVLNVSVNTVFLPFFTYIDVQVAIPAGKLADWVALATFAPLSSGVVFNCGVLLTPLRSTATGINKNQIGPFFIDDPLMTSINCNIVAERGLYVDDTKNTRKIDVEVTFTVTQCDAVGAPTGSPVDFPFTLKGSGSDLTTRGTTCVIVPGFTGRCLIQGLRTTITNWRVQDIGQNQQPDRNSNLAILGQDGTAPYPASDYNPTIPYKVITGIVQDEVKWTQCYSFSDPGVSAFGNTTTVMTQVVASKATNAIKDRKISMIATRKTNHWNGTTFVGPLSTVGATLGENIFFTILKDTQIGNIPDNQIDFVGIVAAFQSVRDYFQDNVTQFGHTFDSENTTLEDMLSAVAESCFCVAYREGQTIKVKPNIATVNSSVLFNHRNIVPDTQSVHVIFGTEADYDGATIDYFDDAAATIKSLTVPNGNAKKPRQVTMAGLRDPWRAALHAWRAYNTILYQNTSVEFEACQEAALALINDRILVADLTSSERQDGELTSVSGVTITTSQPVSIAGGTYTVFLQQFDGTVSNFGVVSSPNTRTLVLASAPASLILNPANGVPTTYILVKNSATRATAFLIDGKSAQNKLTYQIQAHNYSHGYYFVDGLNVWIAPKFNSLFHDVGPYGRSTANFLATAGSDVTRGLVYVSALTAFISGIETTGTTSLLGYFSYTKAVWVNKAATGSIAHFMYWAGAVGSEDFLIDASDVLRVLHNNTTYVSNPSFPIGSWHHIAVTYNFITGLMRLYLDGETVAFTASVPLQTGRVGNAFFPIFNLNGSADDMRLYSRDMAPEEIRELYQKSKL